MYKSRHGHKVLPASLSSYLLQGMVGTPRALPITSPAQGWATLFPAALPYIIQRFWLANPFCLPFTLLAVHSTSPYVTWLRVTSTLFSGCPTSAHFLPFTYNRTPPPYLGAIMSFLFISLLPSISILTEGLVYVKRSFTFPKSSLARKYECYSSLKTNKQKSLDIEL